MPVFVVEIDVDLVGGGHLTDDNITDLIETIIDELDRDTTDPSVSTGRFGDDLHTTIAVTVEETEEFDALARGVSTIWAAFRSAGVGAAGVATPRDLRTRVRPPQAA